MSEEKSHLPIISLTIARNNAFREVSVFRVMLILFVVSSLPSHPINSYPSLAVAVTETEVPSSNVPPALTLPPSLAVTVKVY